MGIQLQLPLCLLVLVALQGVYMEPSVWLDAPYGDDSFNTLARYTDDASMYCNDSRVGGLDYTVVKWILPQLDIMYPEEESCFNTLDGWACWNVSSDGLTMDITLVQDEHFGLYYCEVKDELTDELYIVKRGLNYKGAYFGSTWAKYDVATIWSVTCSIAFGIICGCLGVLYIKLYPDVDEEEEDQDSVTSEKEAHENKAFTAASEVEKNGISTAGGMNPVDTTLPEDDESTTRM